MFLGDDDWLDPGYVAACLAVLEADPDASLVAGRTYYHCGDQVDLEPFPISIVHPDKRVRLLSYYRSVRANGVFYGVVPAQAERVRTRAAQRAGRRHVARGRARVHRQRPHDRATSRSTARSAA